MLNALPYILLVLFCGFLSVLRHRTQNVEKILMIDILCIVVFVWFFGFRGYVMYDWTSYYPGFVSLPDLRTLMNTNVLEWNWDPGFTLLALLSKSIYSDFQFFVLFCHCINTLLLVKFFRRYNVNLPLGMMLYLATTGIIMSTDLLRNSLTILIFVNMLELIEHKRPWQYFLMCILCCTIHKSSLVFFPLYFVLNYKFNNWVLLSIFIVSNIIYVWHIPILKSIVLFISDMLMPSTRLWVETYLSMDAPPPILSIGYLERLLTGFLMFAYMDKLRGMREGNNILINSMVLYLCLFLVLSEFRTVSVRSSMLFSYAYWIMWQDFIHCFSIKNNRRLFVCFVVVYSVARTAGNCHSELANYYNVLFEEHSFSEKLIQFRRHYNEE